MSSHSVRIAKALKEIDLLKKALKENAVSNEYSRGLYNGFELMRSKLNGSYPELLDKTPKKQKEKSE